MLKTLCFTMLLILTLSFPVQANTNNSFKHNFKYKLMKYAFKHNFNVHPKEVAEIADYVEYYGRYTRINKYKIASVIIKESRLNRLAYNKKDGGFSLGQITNYEKDWKPYMPFLQHNRYGLHENVLATCIAINMKANDARKKTDAEILCRYNSNSSNGSQYAKNVSKISEELKKI